MSDIPTTGSLSDVRHLLPPAGRPLPSNDEYTERVIKGYDRMANANVVICGLARTLGDRVESTMAQIEATGQLFSDYGVVIFENDSKDDTAKHLKEWASANKRVTAISENLARQHWPATRDLGRMRDLAEYRNKCRKEVVSTYAGYDYVIVVDTDIAGWSLDGVANTFGHANWDFSGSVSWKKMDKGNWVHYDVWAFRSPDWPPLLARQVNPWLPRVGEPMQPVKSCFGGLGIYRMEAYKSACYAGTDCEHVCLHKSMFEAGFDKLFINPSQVTVY